MVVREIEEVSVESTDSNPRNPEVRFVEPHPYGYIYVGMRVDPPGRAPFVRKSEQRDEALERCRVIAHRIESLDEVVRATVFRAVVIPPVEGSPRFDVIFLVETTSPETIADVRRSEVFGELDADFVMEARNAVRIGDTEETMSGTFLFNHFTAPDARRAKDSFERVARWYTERLGVDNSTLMEPIGESPYVFVNYVRLPGGAVRFMLDQVLRPSFYTSVRAELRASDMTAMPVICEPLR